MHEWIRDSYKQKYLNTTRTKDLIIDIHRNDPDRVIKKQQSISLPYVKDIQDVYSSMTQEPGYVKVDDDEAIQDVSIDCVDYTHRYSSFSPGPE